MHKLPRWTFVDERRVAAGGSEAHGGAAGFLSLLLGAFVVAFAATFYFA